MKDGPLIAFALLVLGILAALLFTWWNAGGKTKHDLVKALETLALDVREGGKLQALERDAAMEGIAQAMQAIESDAPAWRDCPTPCGLPGRKRPYRTGSV